MQPSPFPCHLVPRRSIYFLNTLFSNTLSLRSSLNVSDQVSHPYKTKQQIYVIKSTLGALNVTLADMTHNDKLVRQELTDIQEYLKSLASETSRKLTMFEAKFMIEKHYSVN